VILKKCVSDFLHNILVHHLNKLRQTRVLYLSPLSPETGCYPQCETMNIIFVDGAVAPSTNIMDMLSPYTHGFALWKTNGRRTGVLQRESRLNSHSHCSLSHEYNNRYDGGGHCGDLQFEKEFGRRAGRFTGLSCRCSVSGWLVVSTRLASRLRISFRWPVPLLRRLVSGKLRRQSAKRTQASLPEWKA